MTKLLCLDPLSEHDIRISLTENSSCSLLTFVEPSWPFTLLEECKAPGIEKNGQSGVRRFDGVFSYRAL